MTFKTIIRGLVCAGLLTVTAAQAEILTVTALHRRVDASFSNITTGTEIDEVRNRLREIRIGNCAAEFECRWSDSNGVLHYFFSEFGGEHDRQLLTKIVEANRFQGRSIAALGIGTARNRTQVLTNIRRFLGNAGRVTCGNPGPAACSINLDPGWVQITFTTNGQLQRVRFDAYQDGPFDGD